MNENDPFTVAVEGTGRIAIRVSADGKMQTRSETPLSDAQRNQYLVTIRQGNTIKVDAKVFSQLTKDDLTANAGYGYSVMAESCSAADAESKPTVYGQPRLQGISASFAVVKDETSTVDVHCRPVNAGVTVAPEESFTDNFSDYEMEVQLGSRRLVFTLADADKIGYYNVPEAGATLSYSLVAIRREGGEPAVLQSTSPLQPGKISKLVLRSSAKGTINVTIIYDDSFDTEHIDLIIDTDEDDDNDDDNDDDDFEVTTDPNKETNKQLVRKK